VLILGECLHAAAAVQPFTPRAMPETPRAAKERAAVAEHLRQVSADSVSSASLPINGVHRVLKVGTRLQELQLNVAMVSAATILLINNYIAQWQCLCGSSLRFCPRYLD